MIIACSGGFNVNQLLKHLNYNIIQSNPKILCGFSDITALLNAIYAKQVWLLITVRTSAPLGLRPRLNILKICSLGAL